MQKLLILLHFLLIISNPALAQLAEGTHIQQYTTDNGLPSNGIKGMQWDEENEFLWLATEAGIVRFNGVDIQSYTKENMPSIASERMLFMVRNNARRIYTADQSGNIFLVDKSKPVLWRSSQVKTGVNPYLGKYYLLGISDVFLNKQLGNNIIFEFTTGISRVIPVNDTAYLVHYLNKLYYHSISLKAPVVLPADKGAISHIFKIKDHCFIINDKKETFLFNAGDKNLVPVAIAEKDRNILNAQPEQSMLYWQNGMTNPVFIDSEKAWLLNYDQGAITFRFLSGHIPVGAYIKTVQYSEKNNLIFIGTESKGLIVINKNRVLSKKRNIVNTQNRNSYYSQVELPNGNILTNESDIIGDNPPTNLPPPIEGKFSFYISQTGDTALWYSKMNAKLGHTCLYRYNKITGTTTVYPKIVRAELVTASAGKIYLANDIGIGILDTDSMRTMYRYPLGLSGIVTFDFTELTPGELALATCGGLFRFHTATQKLDTLFSKENICVRSIWKYKDYVFFGTYGSGFYIYKNGIIRPMPLDKNKYLLYPHCFVPDDQGYCWISTNRGLFKSNLAELIDAFQQQRKTVYYHYFGKKDGMEMTELNGGCTPCALRMKNNIISFPSMDGLLWVDPAKAVPMLPAGEIFIDGIMINNEQKNIDSVHLEKLPSQTQEIMLSLGYSAWCNKENIYIDYQLNDTLNWIPVNTGNDALIRLSNLSPGDYVLRIRKLNGFGINNYTYKEIRFNITTPWTKQWWFYLLCLLALLGIVSLFFNIRTRQYKIRQRKLEKQVAEKTRELQEQNAILEKNDNIKTRLISIISHDIVTPLKFVTSAGKNLVEKKNLMPESLKEETIKEMTNTAQELQLLSTNILNWIKYQNENRRLAKETFRLHEPVNQVMSVLNSLAKQKGLALENRVDAGLQVHQYFEALKILVYNLVANAINFSEKGSVIIDAGEHNGEIDITVADEGVGMTPEQIKNIMADQFVISSANMDNKKGNGLGYLIIKDLSKILNAQLRIDSERGKGTVVHITFSTTTSP